MVSFRGRFPCEFKKSKKSVMLKSKHNKEGL